MKRIISLLLVMMLATATFSACSILQRNLSADELLDLGEKHLLELDYEQALVQFEKAIEVEPMNPRAYISAAEAYVELGDTDKAMEVLQQGLELLPDDPEIAAMLEELTAAELLALGEKYLLEQEYEQALEPFLKVTEIRPNIPRGYTGAADAYVGLERIDDAIEVLEIGVELTQDETVIARLEELLEQKKQMNKESYQRDREIYTQYLLNGGYDDLMQFGFDKDYIEISTCMADLNDDETYELLISLARTEFSGSRGSPINTVLLGIQDGSVVKLDLISEDGGGSVGGTYLKLKYDTLTKKHVLVLDGGFRDGIFRGSGFLHVFSSNNGEFSEDMKIERESIFLEGGQSHYLEDAEKIKNETTLHYEDSGFFVWYQIDEEYVSDEEYNTAINRFEDPVDDAYKMKIGTYDEPIATLN